MTDPKVKSMAAAKARKAEATDDPKDFTFEYDGETYTVAAENLDNLELFEAIEDQRYLRATRGFIGQAQWDAFKDKYRTPDGRVPMSGLEGFLSALMEAVGQGN